MGQKFNITEEERKNIRQMYNPLPIMEYVFDAPHITIDGKFLIYKDELYDYNNNENLGEIFSIKNLKFLAESMDITRSRDMFNITEQIKRILNDNIINEQVLKENIVQSFKNNLLLEQDESIGGTVLKWALFIARKVKGLLWTIGGMAVDAFLVASGIGKSVQWIPWAICFALDVYEWTTGNYKNDEEKNKSDIWKALNIGFDIMGMMTAGPVAKAAKWLFKPLEMIKDEAKITQWISKTPKATEFVQNLKGLLGGVGSKMNQLIKYLSVKMPKLASFISGLTGGIGKILGWLGNITEKLGGKIQTSLVSKGGTVGNYLGKTTVNKAGQEVLTRNLGAGMKGGTNMALIGGGMEGGINAYKGIQQSNINTLLNAKSTYNNIKF